MTQQRHELTKIAWPEVFPFTRLFKSFSVAFRMGMISLGIAMLILIFVGGWVMDGIWSTFDYTITPGDVMLHARDRAGYERKMDNIDSVRLEAAARLLVDSRNQADSLSNYITSISSNQTLRQTFANELFELNKKEKVDLAGQKDYYTILNDARTSGKNYNDLTGDIEDQNSREIDKIDDILEPAYEKAEKKISATQLSKEAKKQQLADLERAYDNAQQAVTLRKIKQAKQLQEIEGIGIFAGFAAYERNCIYNAIMSVRYLNFTGGISDYSQFQKNRKLISANVDASTGLAEPSMVRSGNDAPGMVYFLLLAVEGVIWLISAHPIYAAIFLLWCLVVWTLFGGAMYRMAAMRFARNQAVGISEAIGFSMKRFSTFFSAPIVPLVVIAALGLLIAVLSLLGNIPIVGPTVLAIIYGAFIVLGLVMAGILIVYAFSVPLQYPIVAVSSCDACGAISDSYSYFTQRPFHLVFYGAVASVFGMITYLFVRLFAYVALVMIHAFCKLGIFTGGSELGSGTDTMDILWARPEFWNLHDFNFLAAGPWESICSFVIAIWVNLLVAAVAAYLISYFVSASTITYFLIRNSCEATDFDDIYIEGEDEAPLDVEFAEKTEIIEETPAETKESKEEAPQTEE